MQRGQVDAAELSRGEVHHCLAWKLSKHASIAAQAALFDSSEPRRLQYVKLHSGGHMQYKFTLHEDAWFRDRSFDANGQVIGYRVGGMPDGKTARIANFGAPVRNDWRIMRINVDNTQSDWTGHYGSVEDALTALQ